MVERVTAKSLWPRVDVSLVEGCLDKLQDLSVRPGGNWVDGVVGYRICLTSLIMDQLHRRSLVRFRVDSFSFGYCSSCTAVGSVITIRTLVFSIEQRSFSGFVQRLP